MNRTDQALDIAASLIAAVGVGACVVWLGGPIWAGFAVGYLAFAGYRTRDILGR